MTIEERKERFLKFDGCIGVACRECSYDPYKTMAKDCRELIHEDAQAIMKDMAKHLGDEIKAIVEENKTPVYKAPLTAEARERILATIRLKTEVPDLSAHFIQEINELCASLNSLAALVSKLEQLHKGTDPVGGIDDIEREKTELIACKRLRSRIGIDITNAIEEAADVYNYLWVLGYSDKLEHFREDVDEKLARWANRLNGVSDE